MSVSCKPQDLSDGATYLRAIPVGQQLPAAIVAAAAAAGVALDPAALTDAAKCLECSLGIGLNLPVAIAALCNASGYVPANQQVTDFGVATGIKDPVILGALDDLVTGFKNSGVFNLFDAIYPFVGGTDSTNSYNLINPATYQITWHGGVTFSSTGITGNGTTGYGDTGIDPSLTTHLTFNSGAVGVYLSSSINQSIPFGSSNIVGQGTLVWASAIGWVGHVQSNAETTPIGYSGAVKGNYLVSRTAANLTTFYDNKGNTATTAGAPAVTTYWPIFVLGGNSSGTVQNNCNGTISFAWVGAGFTPAQVATIQTLVTAFETSLGRA